MLNILNFDFLTPISDNLKIKVLHFDANPIRIGNLVTELCAVLVFSPIASQFSRLTAIHLEKLEQKCDLGFCRIIGAPQLEGVAPQVLKSEGQFCTSGKFQDWLCVIPVLLKTT